MANKVILVGRTGDKPELSYTADQVAKAVFSIATKDCWKDRESGERKERTMWHQCVAWGKRAEAWAEHMEKGRMYYVEGRLESSSYEKEGQRLHVTRVRVTKVEFI